MSSLVSFLLFDGIIDSLKDWFFWCVFSVDCIVLKLLDAIYSAYGVFVGLSKVTYDNGEPQYLIDIFFGNSTIATVYKGMALIGIALAFAFAILNVVRKIFDTSEKVKMSLGQIVGNLLKSVILILLMNAIIIAVLNVSNTLMQQITYVFNNADALAEGPPTITFDDEQYATMARILDKIANYSMNPSRDSRYNINSCYNDIRRDMQILQNEGVFQYSYQDYKGSGANVVYAVTTKPTWQYILAQIASAHDLSSEQPIDEYDEYITTAISNAMTVIETMDSFKPLSSYTRPATSLKASNGNIRMDTIVFLSGTMDKAHNSYYNKNAGLNDTLRSQYMNGSKSVYDYDQVKDDFDIYNLGCHFLIQVVGLLLCYEFLKIAMNCVARIFNMVLLYLAFPPFAAMMPFDDGAKVKQWTTAFIVQSFSVLGTVISIRLLLLFVPIIFDSRLTLFDNNFYNFMAKLIFLIAVSFTIEKAGNLITGILADQAGFQSVTAGNAGSAAAGATLGAAATLGKKSLGVAKAGANMAAPLGKAAANAAGNFWNRTGGRLADKASHAFGKTGAGKALKKASNWAGGVAQGIKNTAGNWFGANASKYRENMKQKDLQDDIKENARNEFEGFLKNGNNPELQASATNALHNMSYGEANQKYGMNQGQVDAMREKYPMQAQQPPVINNNNNH